ncbi:hypothetical protein A3197_17445 [Candidatus Thiodiazotropha endoloripes]|nr:hypothetical protein A3197_17445 [Candidatus Thiodiazotropha endoloripes]
MEIEFDRSQEMLRKILALKDAQQKLVVICPDCGSEIDVIDLEANALSCSQCGFVAKLDEKQKSKREQVWEQFNKLNSKN